MLRNTWSGWVVGLSAVVACTGDPDGGSLTSTPFSTSATTGDAVTDTGPGPDTDPGTTAGSLDTGGPDSTGSDSAGTTAAGGCAPLPDAAPAWLQPMQQDVVARLSGAAELSPGVTLPDRATAANRAATVTFLTQQWDDMGLAGQLHDYSATGTNVYAQLPATIQTDRTVVVGAHFDSVPASPGANDNATGVAMVLSLGRWLQDLDCREVNVLLVLFDEEEIGLVGSFAFAQWLAQQPLDVLSVHTIDQMGWDADGDRAVELERADPGLFQLYADAEADAPGMTPLVETNTGFTDHVSFRKLGFAAVGLTEEFVSGDTTPHYHLPSDTFATVDLDYLASTTALLHVTIGQLLSPTAGR